MGQILEEKVKKLLPDAVVEKYLSGDDLISSGFKPDILFMDIQMPGKDGMETARIVRQNNKDMILIFVTAVEEYVFQAFDVGAFHYLVKPFSDDKFEEVVKRAIKTIRENSSNEDDDKYMMIQSEGSHIKVFLRDIVYAEVFNRKVIIHTRNADIEYYGKLQEYVLLDDLIMKALVFQYTIAIREWFQYGLYVGTRILQYYLNIYEKDTGKNLIDTYGFYGALSFLHYLISIIAILVMIVMFQNWKVAQEEQFEQEFVLNQVSDMEKHIGELNYSDSDLPETTKSGKGHGIGLNNIRRVAKMYMGDISLEQVDKEVILSIMLQVE